MSDDLGRQIRDSERATYAELVRQIRNLLHGRRWVWTAGMEGEPLDDQARQAANAFWLELSAHPRMLAGVRGWAGVRRQLIRFLNSRPLDAPINGQLLQRHFNSKVRRLLARPPFVHVGWRGHAIAVTAGDRPASLEELRAAAAALPPIPSDTEAWNSRQRMPPVAQEKHILDFLVQLVTSVHKPVLDHEAMAVAWQQLRPPVPWTQAQSLEDLPHEPATADDDPFDAGAFGHELLARDFLAQLPAEMLAAVHRRRSPHARGRPPAILDEIRQRLAEFASARGLSATDRESLLAALVDILGSNPELAAS